MRRETALVIADAAEAVFAAEGLHAAHVDRIARRAGVAVGTLYNYFKDRDAILAALLRARREALFQEMDQAGRENEGRPIRDQIAAFMLAKVRVLTAHRTFFNILYEGELSRMQASYPTAAAEHAKSIEGFYARLEGLVKRGVASGELRAGHIELDAWLLGGMLRAITVRNLRENKPCGPDEVAHLVEVFLSGARSR
jgi:AcrR family transcriptional regulator